MRQGSGVWRSLRDGDYNEQDVWDVVMPVPDDKKPKMLQNSREVISASACLVVGRNPPSGSAARMIQSRGSGGSSKSNDNETAAKLMVQHSAPVNIHDWSKMMSGKKQQQPQQQPSRKTFKHSNSWIGFDVDEDEDEDEYEEDGEDEDDGYKEPPHEMLARRMASCQISSFSVVEGVGRTLKGRDLSKVRNAVLTRTGFLESPPARFY
ncbi:hypothetical protein LINGRAHAP2_LOCUS21168 [Linum grandiflorum]